MTPDTIRASRKRNCQANDDLADDETLKLEDYDGASAALLIDRGHQAPLAAFSDTPCWSETNILSSITLQSPALAQAAWQRLEARENALAIEEKIAFHVLTGPTVRRMIAKLRPSTTPRAGVFPNEKSGDRRLIEHHSKRRGLRARSR